MIYAYVISYVALSVQNVDDWARVGNGSEFSTLTRGHRFKMWRKTFQVEINGVSLVWSPFFVNSVLKVNSIFCRLDYAYYI